MVGGWVWLTLAKVKEGVEIADAGFEICVEGFAVDVLDGTGLW